VAMAGVVAAQDRVDALLREHPGSRDLLRAHDRLREVFLDLLRHRDRIGGISWQGQTSRGGGVAG
jgi:hypothetical protein